MRANRIMRWQAGALLIASISVTGCIVAAAGAGAAGAIAFTNRGAKSTVNGSVDQTFDKSIAAFQQLGITETGRRTEDSGAKRALTGMKAPLEVTVELSRATATTTSVEVYAKRNAVDYDKDFAKDVLNHIIQGS